MKKGLVTTYIMLGIVILTIVVTVYTFREDIMAATFGREIEEATTLPLQAEKVNIFVKSCIKEVGENAIAAISLQGGYHTLPAGIVPATPLYPFANSLDLFGNGGASVPYWFFETANGVQQNQVPSFAQMEAELESYMDELLELCLNDFQTLKQQGYTIIHTAPNTDVSIGDKEVIFNVHLPTYLNINEFEFTFDTFKVTVPSDLRELYDLAKEVMLYENEKYFIEERVLDMMVVYDSIPFSGVDFECTPQSWTKTGVYDDLKSVIAANIPSVKMKGTMYQQGNEPKSFVIDALEKKHADTAIRLQYDKSWPLLMTIVGENDEVIRGKPFTMGNEASKFLAALFCLNDYHFVYNLKFPVLITIEREDTTFQFATQAIVVNNQPRENRILLETEEIETPLCDTPTKEINVVADAYARDGVLRPVTGAKIAFKCLNQVCEIGTTDTTGLTQPFPLCFNGLVTAEKAGFHRAEEVVSTNQDIETVSLTLEPLQELFVEVKVIDEGNERSLYPSEQLWFTFENEQDKYTTTFIAPGQVTVRLMEGDYTVTSSLVVESSSGFTLEEKQIEVCSDVPTRGILGIAGIKKRQCVQETIPATTISQMPVGGSSARWYIDRDNLLASQKLTLYTYRGPTPKTVDEITNVYEMIGENTVPLPVLT